MKNDLLHSGNLELFVKGELSAELKAEIENEIKSNLTIASELSSIDDALLHYANLTSVTPSENLSFKIWNKIENQENRFFKLKKSSFSFLKIAATILFFSSVFLNIYLFKIENSIKSSNLSLKKEMDLYENEISMLNNPSMQLCKLVSTTQNENATLLVCVNKKTMQISVLSPNLPEKGQGQMYQLWAIIDGKPMCMGTFDAEKKIYKMKVLPTMPNEFGVTIENGKLGSSQPTSNFLVRGI